MYFAFTFWLLSVIGYFTGWLFTLWLACSLFTSVVAIGLYYKSISDYAYLAAERWRMLILLDEVRRQGFNDAMKESYYFLDGMRTNWVIISCYIRKLHLYSTCGKHWFMRQWIARMPPELETSLLELDTSRLAVSACTLDLMLDTSSTLRD